MISSSWQTDHSQMQNEAEMGNGPLVFRLVLDDDGTIAASCSNKSWNFIAKFEIYTLEDPIQAEISDGEEISDISEIWMTRQHLGDHSLSESTVSIMKGWIQECLESHDACSHTVMGGYSPTRLIDVGPKDGSKEPFLFEVRENLPDRLSEVSLDPLTEEKTRTYQTKEGTPKVLHYATLSHCWGGTQHLQSTMETLNNRKQSIPLSSMNQTFRDAVNVTRDLDLQYLWIDSLCIIQDSPSDWSRESGKMCSVYSNAVVNISAASSSNGDESCFDYPTKTREVSHRINQAEEKF
jgi:hypothetical protein